MTDQPIPQDLIPWIPQGWKLPIAIISISLPYLTRAYYAIKSGGGIRGIWHAIWFGTNQPIKK